MCSIAHVVEVYDRAASREVRTPFTMHARVRTIEAAGKAHASVRADEHALFDATIRDMIRINDKIVDDINE